MGSTRLDLECDSRSNLCGKQACFSVRRFQKLHRGHFVIAFQIIVENPGSTATQVAKSIGLKSASISSKLTAQVNEGKLIRVAGEGVRGGYGYYLPPTTPSSSPPYPSRWDRLFSADFEQSPSHSEHPPSSSQR